MSTATALHAIFFYLLFFVFGIIVGRCSKGYVKHEADTFKEGWEARERGVPLIQNPYELHTAVWHRWEDGWTMCWHKQREEERNE